VTNQTKAFLLAGTAVLFWSTVGSAFKLTLRFLEPTELLFYTLPVAIVVSGGLLAVRGSWRAVRATTGKELVRSALVGCINPFLYYNMLFVGYDLLPTQVASTINFGWPIVLVVMSAVFLKQPFTLRTAGALVLGFAGVFLIATEGAVTSLEFRSLPGVLLMGATTVVWSSFWILNMTDRRDAGVKLFLNFVFGYAFMLGYWAVCMEKRLPPIEGLLGAAYAGVFEMGVTFFLWLTALSLARRTADVANLIFLTPFLALVCINLTVGERILPTTVVGLACIVAGIVIKK
jgi:drug/metabolite transporter (DMT)-like permease